MRYSVVLEPVTKEPGFEGYYYAHVPALDLTTHGHGIDGALQAVRELVVAWVDAKRVAGEPVPLEEHSIFTHIEIADAVHGS